MSTIYPIISTYSRSHSIIQKLIYFLPYSTNYIEIQVVMVTDQHLEQDTDVMVTNRKTM